MRFLADFLLAAVDLFELEAKALRRGVMRLAIGIMLLVVCLALLLGGFGLALWGFYLLLVVPLGPIGAAFLTAAVALVLAMIPLLAARYLTR